MSTIIWRVNYSIAQAHEHEEGGVLVAKVQLLIWFGLSTKLALMSCVGSHQKSSGSTVDWSPTGSKTRRESATEHRNENYIIEK